MSKCELSMSKFLTRHLSTQATGLDSEVELEKLLLSEEKQGLVVITTVYTLTLLILILIITASLGRSLLQFTMSLPLPYRPERVDELMKEEEAEQKRNELKFVIKKPDVFLSAMTEWYNCKLTKLGRSRLTKNELMKRAFHEAYQLQLPYRALPRGWIKTLQRNTGLRLFVKTTALQVCDPSQFINSQSMYYSLPLKA